MLTSWRSASSATSAMRRTGFGCATLDNFTLQGGSEFRATHTPGFKASLHKYSPIDVAGHRCHHDQSEQLPHTNPGAPFLERVALRDTPEARAHPARTFQAR